jgi:hypothetical protein
MYHIVEELEFEIEECKYYTTKYGAEPASLASLFVGFNHHPSG